jgi:hypothetical protein
MKRQTDRAWVRRAKRGIARGWTLIETPTSENPRILHTPCQSRACPNPVR